MEGSFFPDRDIAEDVLEPGKVRRKVRAHGEKIMLVEVFFEAGAAAAVHEHPHDQATYCLEGEFLFDLGGKARTLRPGDSVFIPGGLRHGVSCLSKGRVIDAFTPRREDFLKG